MVFNVTLAKKAQIDVSKAEKWLGQISLATVERWRARFLKAIRLLEDDASRYPLAEDFRDAGFDLREATFGRWPHVYRILFAIHGKSVLILRVRHAARDQVSDDKLL